MRGRMPPILAHVASTRLCHVGSTNPNGASYEQRICQSSESRGGRRLVDAADCLCVFAAGLGYLPDTLGDPARVAADPLRTRRELGEHQHYGSLAVDRLQAVHLSAGAGGRLVVAVGGPIAQAAPQ